MNIILFARKHCFINDVYHIIIIITRVCVCVCVDCTPVQSMIIIYFSGVEAS